MGVTFDENKHWPSVFVPDVIVVCDKSKITPKGLSGAPDMIIEILSSSTASHDTVLKFNRYLETGVREYWIVNPESHSVQQHVLMDGDYVTHVYDCDAKVKVAVLDERYVDLTLVFPGAKPLNDDVMSAPQ